MPGDYHPRDEKYVDAERLVDAGAGALPDYTWYFKDQDHERTGRCDVVMRLTLRLACGAEDPTADSMEEWPRFSYGRDGRKYSDMLRQARDVNRAGLSAADITELDAAIVLIQAIVDSTRPNPATEAQAEQRLRAIMEKIGAWTPPEEPGFWERAGEKVSRFLSEAAWYAHGPRGFLDPIWRIWWD
jgi:hypothetical protein